MPKSSTRDVGDQIVALKEQGKTWGEISEHTGLPQGKCMFLYEQKTVSPKTRITAKTEDELKQKIAAARQEGQSWGKISARSGKSEGYCKKAFEEVTGSEALGNRIGKGGRYPGGAQMATGATKKATGQNRGVVKSAKKTAPAKKATAKKAAAKKATGKKAVAKKAAKAAA